MSRARYRLRRLRGAIPAAPPPEPTREELIARLLAEAEGQPAEPYRPREPLPVTGYRQAFLDAFDGLEEPPSHA